MSSKTMPYCEELLLSRGEYVPCSSQGQCPHCDSPVEGIIYDEPAEDGVGVEGRLRCLRCGWAAFRCGGALLEVIDKLREVSRPVFAWELKE